VIGFRLDYWGLRSLFWDVTQRRMVVTDVSGQPIAPIFKGAWTLRLTLEDVTDR